MKLNHNKGAIPLYLQIKEEVKADIENKRYEQGELIPSELEFEKHYGVSRITVRQAILDLEKEGYVKRTRGKGTSVIYSDKTDEELIVTRSFYKEMAKKGKIASTSSASIELIPASLEVAKRLDIERGDEVYRLYRVRCADDEEIVVFESYMLGEYDFPLNVEAYAISMYDVYEQVGVQKPIRANECFEACLANDTLAQELKIDVGSPILKRTRVAYNENQKAIEYTVCYYRGDRYTYSVQLKEK